MHNLRYMAIIITILITSYVNHHRMQFYNGKILTAINQQNEIQTDLIESINGTMDRLEMQGPDETCMAISNFLKTLKKAKINRGKNEN